MLFDLMLHPDITGVKFLPAEGDISNCLLSNSGTKEPSTAAPA